MLYCTGAILVEACRHSSPPPISCTVQVLFPPKCTGIAPPLAHFLLGARVVIGTACSLHVAGQPKEPSMFDGGGVF